MGTDCSDASTIGGGGCRGVLLFSEDGSPADVGGFPCFFHKVFDLREVKCSAKNQDTSSGNVLHTCSYVVSFPSKNVVIFHSYVKLPEGNEWDLRRNSWHFMGFR